MKKIIVSLVFTLSLYTTTAAPTYAIFCSNCSTIVQQFIDYARQGLQYAKDAVSASQNTITAYQQTLETVNNTILIPMKDAAALMVLMKSGDNIQNLVLGSLGTDPLLIKNPEEYFKNKAIGTVEASLGDIAAYKSIYGDSVLSSLVASSRYQYSDYYARLKAISQSSIPSTVQTKACDDEMLSQLAREDVEVLGQPLDQAAYTARKQYFYNQFCAGNPQTDKNTAQALHLLQQARPSIGGWDAWLALTGGDNPYVKATQLKTEIDVKADQMKEQAKTDYIIGGGVKSLTKCNKYAENDINGNLYGETTQGPCISEEIKQVSSAISSSYREALETPMKLIRDSFGTGAGSLITTAFSTINLLKGISNSLSSVTGEEVSNNTGGTVTSTSPPVQNLTNDPQAKETLTSPAIKQLTSHQTALNNLQTIDQNYLNQIAYYQGQLDGVKACFDQLVQDHGVANDSRVVAAMNYYSGTSQTNTDLKNTLTQELSLIATAKTLVTETLSKIQASNSSEEIAALFTNYQNTVDSGNLPNSGAAALRDGEYITFQGNVEQSVSQNGAIYNFKQECSQIRQQLEWQAPGA